jgi:hypothetical protein
VGLCLPREGSTISMTSQEGSAIPSGLKATNWSNFFLDGEFVAIVNMGYHSATKNSGSNRINQKQVTLPEVILEIMQQPVQL